MTAFDNQRYESIHSEVHSVVYYTNFEILHIKVMQNNIIFGENSRIIDTSVIELEILKKTKKNNKKNKRK